MIVPRPLRRSEWRSERDRGPPSLVERDIRRIVSLWMGMRTRFGTGGPYLFGEWSVPDAFFTPVAARFRHYQIDLAACGDDGSAAAYRDALLAQPDFLEWSADALSDR